MELRGLESGSKVEKLIVGWKNKVTSVCAIANVGKVKLDEMFLTSTTRTGNYWTCFLIDLASQNVIYYNLLVWNAPQDLISNLDFLISTVRKIFPHTNEHDFTMGTIKKGYKKTFLNFKGLVKIFAILLVC